MSHMRRDTLVKEIRRGAEQLGDYFTIVDVMAWLREELRENFDQNEVRWLGIQGKVFQKSEEVVKRGKNEYSLLKRYGAPEPPDDFRYSPRGRDT